MKWRVFKFSFFLLTFVSLPLVSSSASSLLYWYWYNVLKIVESLAVSCLNFLRFSCRCVRIVSCCVTVSVSVQPNLQVSYTETHHIGVQSHPTKHQYSQEYALICNHVVQSSVVNSKYIFLEKELLHVYNEQFHSQKVSWYALVSVTNLVLRYSLTFSILSTSLMGINSYYFFCLDSFLFFRLGLLFSSLF